MENNPVFPHEISGINSGMATFQFQGQFHKRAVTWLCTLQTLDHHYQSLLENQQVTPTQQITLKKFICIEDEDSDHPRIHVGLDVESIDIPTVRKSIIMINNYKNLHPGLHEYGTPYHYPRK